MARGMQLSTVRRPLVVFRSRATTGQTVQMLDGECAMAVIHRHLPHPWLGYPRRIKSPLT